MKSTVLFLAGIIVGAVVTWFVFSKDVILVPTGTTLVEVNRFNGKAREVFYSYEEANQLDREEDARDRKAEAAWEKAQQSTNPAVSESTPVEAKEEAPALSAEELALVKFSAKVVSGQPSSLQYSIYNGTGKTLVLAQARVEAVNSESGVPLARNVEIRVILSPSTDISSSVNIENGYIDIPKMEGLKVTLTKVLAQ